MAIALHNTVNAARRGKKWDALLTAYTRSGGLHYFSKDTMDFWGSKLVGQPVTAPNDASGRTWFVTSEMTFDGDGRGYSVRVFDPSTGHIDTLDEFNGYTSAEDATAAMHSIAGI